MPCDLCHQPTSTDDSLPGVCGGSVHAACAIRASITFKRPRGLPQLTARVTPEELAMVDRRAKAAGMSRANWIRLRALTS